MIHPRENGRAAERFSRRPTAGRKDIQILTESSRRDSQPGQFVPGGFVESRPCRHDGGEPRVARVRRWCAALFPAGVALSIVGSVSTLLRSDGSYTPYRTDAFWRLPQTLCGKSTACRSVPAASNGNGRRSPVNCRWGRDLASSANGGDTHISATSSVFGITAMRNFAESGCQQVATPVAMHSRSVGNANGSFDRHKKQAVRLFMRNGTGSIALSNRSVVRSAMPTPVPLPWLSGERSRAQMRVIRGLSNSNSGAASISSRPTTFGSMPAPE